MKAPGSIAFIFPCNIQWNRSYNTVCMRMWAFLNCRSSPRSHPMLCEFGYSPQSQWILADSGTTIVPHMKNSLRRLLCMFYRAWRIYWYVLELQMCELKHKILVRWVDYVIQSYISNTVILLTLIMDLPHLWFTNLPIVTHQ